jgi:hypothetical protein
MKGFIFKGGAYGRITTFHLPSRYARIGGLLLHQHLKIKIHEKQKRLPRAGRPFFVFER